MEKHFKLTSETKVNSFKSIEKGDKGGWVEKEVNLYGNAKVYGDAEAFGHAEVPDAPEVYGDAWEKTPFQFQGTKYFVNEVKKGHLKIGCITMSYREWKRNLRKLAKRMDIQKRRFKNTE